MVEKAKTEAHLDGVEGEDRVQNGVKVNHDVDNVEVKGKRIVVSDLPSKAVAQDNVQAKLKASFLQVPDEDTNRRKLLQMDGTIKIGNLVAAANKSNEPSALKKANHPVLNEAALSNYAVVYQDRDNLPTPKAKTCILPLGNQEGTVVTAKSRIRNDSSATKANFEDLEDQKETENP